MRSIVMWCLLATLLFQAGAAAQTKEQGERHRPVSERQEFHRRSGLDNLFHRIETSRIVRIAYLGGSITEAGGGWRDLTFNWFRLNYPKTVFTQISAGIGGTGSDLGAFRVEEEVLKEKPDLLFVEFAVNDAARSPEDIIRSMEGIIRKTRRSNPLTDICFVYTIAEAQCNLLLEGRLHPAVVAMEQVADRYGIPSIHMGIRVAHLLKEGKLVFAAPADRNDSVIVFTQDKVHPLSESGHPLYAAVVAKYLEKMRNNRKAAAHPLPSPLTADNWEHARMIGLGEISRVGEWNEVPADHPTFRSFIQRLPGIWKGTPGSRLTFRFRGTTLGLYDVMGPGTGSLKVTVDGNELEVPRFDRYCTYWRLANRVLFDRLEDTEHEVVIEVTDTRLDKPTILTEANLDKYRKNPGDYTETNVYIGRLLLVGELLPGGDRQPEKRLSILGLGDSITEGSDFFHCYLYPLWEKLLAGGYEVDFVGPRESKCRIGTLKHAGFGGKHAEFLDAAIDTLYRNHPADIVLLHTGHNHFDTENPVAGIVAAQESIIRKIKAIRPEAKILVAQVITSGKLPKYSYIPALNTALAQMVGRIGSADVVLVDQASGFDWETETIHDKVHPNAAGAEQMASVWYDAIHKLVPPSVSPYHPERLTYKETDSLRLQLHLFRPEGMGVKAEKRPAIVFFFGGGWQLGTPLQFYRECAYYAAKGMVAVTVDYRISWLDHTTPFDAFEDAKDALRWLRTHAADCGIDPDRIAVAGASAGGQLAAALGVIGTEKEEGKAYQPNLMLLYYPVVDNSDTGYGTPEMKRRYTEISPLHRLHAGVPPSLFLLGDKDPIIPVSTARAFKQRCDAVGVACEVHILEGAGHPLFLYREPLTPVFNTVRKLSDVFLQEHGYIR